MNSETLKTHLDRFPNLKIGVLGDFCLDAYWLLDQTNVEFSVETGKPTNAICKQSYSLGGAGNVISNLLALGIGSVHAFGVIGDDVFGREMIDLLRRGNVNTDGMIIQKESWDTCVYAKPYVDLDEKERIDFGRFNKLADATADRLLAGLEQTLDSLDGLIVNQQIRSGIHSDHLTAGLQKIIDKHPDKIILLDARDVCDRYRNLIFKLNAGEAARVCGQMREVHQAVSPEELSNYAKEIFGRTARPVVITRGDRGILAYDGQAFSQIPGILTVGPIDTVGAGDTTASAVTSALAAGAKLAEAIEIGNFAAAVIVRKLRQTGTATPEEILSIAVECDYVYQPELAEDIRKRSFRQDTEIEIVSRDFQWGEIRHVIFDHDGTISTLRQGWEAIMEPVMVRAILGPHYLDAPEELYQRIVHRVREYIDQSTGIETIVQMRSLADMVRQFGQVPHDQILDAAGYKKIYNDALMEMVRRRTDKLVKKELDTADYTIKGAPEFLKSLHDRGIKLYLASGTDHNDVVQEAKSLGYADLFEGRIYGWGGKGDGSAKKMVIEQILRENKLSGCELACIGDGPVELRLCKKVGGLAIGIASDEVRRYDLNLTKRTRLIKSGADILIPDYSQRSALLAMICAQ